VAEEDVSFDNFANPPPAPTAPPPLPAMALEAEGSLLTPEVEDSIELTRLSPAGPRLVEPDGAATTPATLRFTPEFCAPTTVALEAVPAPPDKVEAVVVCG
jgi:hypothetical protein